MREGAANQTGTDVGNGSGTGLRLLCDIYNAVGKGSVGSNLSVRILDGGPGFEEDNAHARDSYATAFSMANNLKLS